MVSDATLAKQHLRSVFAQRRSGVPEREAELAGRAVAAAVLEEPRIRSARRVALYAATSGELPTRMTFEALGGVRVSRLLPRLEYAGMVWAHVQAWEDMVPGRFGVPCPASPPAARRLSREDVVLMPGVAFDREGWRLGRGGGHYDQAFPPSDDDPWLVGVGFAFQWIAEVPHNSRDRRVDAIVTEHGWVWRAGLA